MDGGGGGCKVGLDGAGGEMPPGRAGSGGGGWAARGRRQEGRPGGRQGAGRRRRFVVEWLAGGGYDVGMRCRGVRAALAGLCLLAAGCGDRESAARNDLGQAGYALTGAELFRAAAADDTAALARFADGGMDLAARDAAGDTALHVAAAAGAGRAARFLLDRKLPLDAAGAGGRTPLHAAAAAGRAEMAAWLLRQGADPAKRDGEGYKPLLRAVEAGRTGVVETMAPFVRDDLDTALLLAALLGKPEMIDVLTDFGASVYARTDDGRTALMVAAANGHMGTVNMLMALGANRFAVDADGMTAAELAAAAGHDEVAAALSGEVAAEEFGLEPPEELAAVPQPAPPGADTSAADGRPAANVVPAADDRPAGNDLPTADAAPAPADGRPPPPLDGATLATADRAGDGGERVAAGVTASAGVVLLTRSLMRSAHPATTVAVLGAFVYWSGEGAAAGDAQLPRPWCSVSGSRASRRHGEDTVGDHRSAGAGGWWSWRRATCSRFPRRSTTSGG